MPANQERNLYVANWKKGGTHDTARMWVEDYANKKNELVAFTPNVIVAPHISMLALVADGLARFNVPIAVAAQHLDLETDGLKHTGTGHEPSMVRDSATHVILGHTETRKDLTLTNDDVNVRLDIAKKHGLKPIVCVASVHQAEAIARHDRNYSDVIAYEPPANIGTVAADPQEANAVCSMILEMYPHAQVLYGGSVDRANVTGFLAQSAISGVLVGDKSSGVGGNRHSLYPELSFFEQILQAAAKPGQSPLI